MSTTTIIVKNLTTGDLELTNLSVPNAVIPADESLVELTKWNTVSEIREDPELRALISDGKLMMADDGSPPLSPSGTPLMQPEPREGSSAILVSYDWTDRCTWYGDSVSVENETLKDSGDGLTFNSAHKYWINLVHGKMYGEDHVSAPYKVKVYANGVLQTEREPFTDEGGDFVVDYAQGAVTFESKPQTPVTVDYHYEQGSTLYLRPDTGKVLIVEDSEVQFALDVIMNDTIFFQAWAYNPNDLPNKMPVTSKTTYKKIKDFLDESRGAYPVIPAIGGPVRGTQHNTLNLPFLYKTIKELYSSMGLEIRVWLEHDTPMDGEFATASFYCTSHVE